MAVAILAGTTGLVGSQLLDMLLENPSYDRVIALSRKPVLVKHSKLHNLVVDFDRLEDQAEQLRADDVYCCLGTTIREAGSKEAFRKVDFEYPLSLAQIAHRQGATQYLLVTAMGSDKDSSIFYNRVKGEIETAVGHVGFASLHIFQPSMLMGLRKERRVGETAGKVVMTALGFMIPKKYKAIESAKVARAMVSIALKRMTGIHVHHSGVLQDF